MGMYVKKTNVMKHLIVMVMTVCLVLSCFSMNAYAASGKIMFTDPSAKTGEVVQVRGVLESAGNGIEDREIVMSYDTSILKFKEGDSVEETSSGKLTYKLSGSKETDGRVEFMMSFEALKSGTAKISVDSYKAWTTRDEKIDCTVGSSTITIAAGETNTDQPTDTPTVAPTEAEQVEVNGVTYTLSGDFAETNIPEEFTKTTVQYAGSEVSMVLGDNYGVYLGYLVDEGGKGEFFLYSQEDATFSPYTEIAISETTKIVLLSHVEGITLPEPYVATTVLVNGVDFPAWQNAEKSELCVLYAVNSNGIKSLYQLDSEEGTYQKFEVPEVSVEDEKEESFFVELSKALGENVDKYILAIGICLILFLIIIVVLSVKLFNRNAELDELYDEFGIDLDDEDMMKSVARKNEKLFKEESQEIMVTRLDEDDEIVMKEETEAEDDVLVKEETEEEVVSELEQPIQESDFAIQLEEIKEETLSEILPNKEDFFDDDDESDYEIDFIDLDD